MKSILLSSRPGPNAAIESEHGQKETGRKDLLFSVHFHFPQIVVWSSYLNTIFRESTLYAKEKYAQLLVAVCGSKTCALKFSCQDNENGSFWHK